MSRPQRFWNFFDYFSQIYQFMKNCWIYPFRLKNFNFLVFVESKFLTNHNVNQNYFFWQNLYSINLFKTVTLSYLKQLSEFLKVFILILHHWNCDSYLFQSVFWLFMIPSLDFFCQSIPNITNLIEIVYPHWQKPIFYGGKCVEYHSIFSVKVRFVWEISVNELTFSFLRWMRLIWILVGCAVQLIFTITLEWWQLGLMLIFWKVTFPILILSSRISFNCFT